jgi:hypothetical protein
VSRRKKYVWEIGVCAVLAVIALRSVRHTPLFSIAALAIIPPHLTDVLFRFREHFARLKELFSRTGVQYVSSGVLAIAAGATLYASMTIRKEHPFTMEAPQAGCRAPNRPRRCKLARDTDVQERTRDPRVGR